ncbi:helix-turn-helix domain-containing protein [Fodinicola acaciae]|uniref:helix-turn-helix domain-containing protein n=1 Tax=Fodinicola acaciae TaxID=2681555 RepID=UPI0013D32B96|nr:helix-turn-helix domain-containing protein [Fodinicola acaciae]
MKDNTTNWHSGSGRDNDDKLKRGGAQPAAAAPRRLLTVTEACEVLRISSWTLYRLIWARQLNTIKIGRRRLIPAVAVDEMLKRLAAEGETL